jgi:hypothetical protein
MTRKQMLRGAAHVLEDRCKLYGDPAASMTTVAARWSIALGHKVTPEQVVLCLIDLKLARLACDPTHQDGWIDVAAYAAIGAELTSRGDRR